MRRAAAWSLLILGCGGGASAPGTVSSGSGDDTSGGGTVVIEEDDPRVSRSAGAEGGVVVLWPRVMGLPDSEPQVLQQHMVELARRVFPDRPLDVRPDPERVCPRTGCRGVSLGALLIVQHGSCATVAVIGRPGTADLTLVPFSGRITLRDRQIPFREPPESHITLNDSHACGELVQQAAEHDADVERELRQAG